MKLVLKFWRIANNFQFRLKMKFEFARKRDKNNFWRKSKMKLNRELITNENLMKTSFFFSSKFRWRWNFCSFCFRKKIFFRKLFYEKKNESWFRFRQQTIAWKFLNWFFFKFYKSEMKMFRNFFRVCFFRAIREFSKF